MLNGARKCLLIPGIFLLAFSVRFAATLYLGNYKVSNDVETNRAAVSVARSGQLGDIFFRGSGPSAHLAPLHPLMLGAIYRCFGIETPRSLLIQACIAITIVSLIMAGVPLLAERARLSPAAGILAAAVMAVLPFNLYVETSGTWEQAESCAALL